MNSNSNYTMLMISRYNHNKHLITQHVPKTMMKNYQK